MNEVTEDNCVLSGNELMLLDEANESAKARWRSLLGESNLYEKLDIMYQKITKLNDLVKQAQEVKLEKISSEFPEVSEEVEIEEEDLPITSFIVKYAYIDGSHHKQWIIDQVLRRILKHEYNNFIKFIDYEWDTGISP